MITVFDNLFLKSVISLAGFFFRLVLECLSLWKNIPYFQDYGDSSTHQNICVYSF